jgi:hypothetical protein
MIEKIVWQDETLALVLRSSFDKDGVNFITDDRNPLQLGVIKHPKGTIIKPHIHNKLEKIINNIHEILHIEYGNVDANFYDDAGKIISSTLLHMGDTILLMSGGHGFNILEDSKIIEVKQGPYGGVENDKKRF